MIVTTRPVRGSLDLSIKDAHAVTLCRGDRSTDPQLNTGRQMHTGEGKQTLPYDIAYKDVSRVDHKITSNNACHQKTGGRLLHCNTTHFQIRLSWQTISMEVQVLVAVSIKRL